MGRCGAGLRNRNTSHGRESAKSMISQNPPVSSPQCQWVNIWSLIDSLVLGGHQSQFSDTVQIGAKTVSRKLSVSATRLGRRVKTGRWSPGSASRIIQLSMDSSWEHFFCLQYLGLILSLAWIKYLFSIQYLVSTMSPHTRRAALCSQCHVASYKPRDVG